MHRVIRDRALGRRAGRVRPEDRAALGRPVLPAHRGLHVCRRISGQAVSRLGGVLDATGAVLAAGLSAWTALALIGAQRWSGCGSVHRHAATAVGSMAEVSSAPARIEGQVSIGRVRPLESADRAESATSADSTAIVIR